MLSLSVIKIQIIIRRQNPVLFALTGRIACLSILLVGINQFNISP